MFFSVTIHELAECHLYAFALSGCEAFDVNGCLREPVDFILHVFVTLPERVMDAPVQHMTRDNRFRFRNIISEQLRDRWIRAIDFFDVDQRADGSERFQVASIVTVSQLHHDRQEEDARMKHLEM